MSFTIRFARATPPDLDSLSATLGHPLRWLGGAAPRAGEAGQFYEDGRSTRGVEFLWSRGFGVVRVPTLGNDVDLRLAIGVVRALRDPNAPIRTDAGELSSEAFDAAHGDAWIKSRIDEDVALVRDRAALEPIAVVGPRRVAYIGPRLLATLPPGSAALYDTLVRVQYPAQDEEDRFQAGVVRMATQEGAAVRLSSWAPGVRYLVGPVDVLMLLGDPPIHIAAYDAVRIAPGHVRMLDERHWLIEAVDDNEWTDLLARAKPLALTDLRSAPRSTEAPSIDHDPDLSSWIPAPGAKTATPPPTSRRLPPPRIGAFERATGHPPGLAILFLTEMWERFSFYGMRGLLKSYMMFYLFVEMRRVYHTDDAASPLTAGDPNAILGWPFIRDTLGVGEYALQGQASTIYGWYVGLVYLTPLIGGFVADRYLGRKYTVMIGAVLMAIGHFVMAWDNLFFIALFFLIIGNGAFKPNISTQVGNLYPEGDPRRDRAFSTFYVGINLGAFIANFVCGTLALTHGWHYAFGAAGVGMVIGLLVYVLGQPLLGADRNSGASAQAEDERPTGPMSRDEWMVVGALVVLCALNIVFWGVYEQQGNTMQTWADNQTIWPKIGSFQIPTTWFQSFNPGMIFLFTPFVNIFWAWQQRKGTEPSSVTKMAIGCFMLGFSFIAMVIGAQFLGADGKGSLFWPVACTGMLTLGELYLSPIGLSLVSKVAPRRIVSMMMGMWFMSSFFGGILSGWLGTFYDTMSRPSFFMMLMALGGLAGLAMTAFNRPLKNILGHNV